MLSEKPTSAESVGADSFHGTGNAWRAMAGPKSLAQHVSGITVFNLHAFALVLITGAQA
jgi:hypothetical protein